MNVSHFLNLKVFDSLEETKTLEVAAVCLCCIYSSPSEFPGNLKAHALLFVITVSFQRFVCLSHPICVFSALVIQHGVLVTDVNDRSV